MNGYFDSIIKEIMDNNPQLTAQRTTVEKEVFHHDILVAISESEFAERLVFMGGTCLRLCYGGERLSEDLDFCTDKVFKEDEIVKLGELVKDVIFAKYKYQVEVTHPVKDRDTDTWIVKIIIHPESESTPSQKIHLDICQFPSIAKQIRLVRNNYEIGMVSNQVYFNVESLEEIMSDKLIAFAYRNRIKNRDLWDINWLHEKGVSFNNDLIIKKLELRKKSREDFTSLFRKNLEILKVSLPNDYFTELSRFVPNEVFKNSIMSTKKANLVISTILDDFISAF